MRLFAWGALAAALIAFAGCNRNSGPDPSAANLAPVEQTAASAPAAAVETEPVAAAPQPPPPLPQYDQPPCPGQNYIWTPGYWDYEQAGYYWVPGAWVMAPYVDALWTPPYWDFSAGQYRFHRGYWARHIGYYGGINYGFGYNGLGFSGGYWNGSAFVYNRAVTHLDTHVVHDYYSHSVVNNTPDNRVSFHGPGGVGRAPMPAELAAAREPRTAPVPVQVQHMREAAGNRQQFATFTHGRPAVAAAPAPRREPERAAVPAPMQQRRAEPPRPEPVPGVHFGAPAGRGPEPHPAPAAHAPEPHPAPAGRPEPPRAEKKR
jgi:hypothetical protein